MPIDYLAASIKTAQYLAGLTVNQNIWSETGKLLVSFFGADVGAIGERQPDGQLFVHHESYSERFSEWDNLGDVSREAISEVLESGFLTFRAISSPEPLSLAFLPVTQENRVIAVMLAGHGISEPIPKEILNVYLAVAGLVGTTFSRLKSEQELRGHRLHLEQLVKERTAELTIANGKLQQEIIEHQRVQAEKMEMEHQLQEARKLESLGVLAGGIAHDFNNILQIISGNCALIQMESTATGIFTDAIFKAVEHAADLCRQMLAYAGKTPATQTKVNVRMLVDEILKMLKMTINQNAEIICNSLTELPLVMGDVSQLRQIVMNLIINAAEALEGAQGEIRVILDKTEVISGKSDKDYLGKPITPGLYIRLKVTDTGCGMSEETRQRIFEPFFTTKFTGRGLGMSAVLGIIMAHKGALQLNSQLGHGSTFTVYLPAQASEPRGDATIMQLDTPLSWQGSGTVLLVEDEDQIRLLVSKFIIKMGFSVIEASNGKEALDLYMKNAEEITVVLTDMGMPVMDGYTMFREFKKINHRLPIIISSGFGDAEVTSRVSRAEIAGLVSKPYHYAQLQEVLKSVVSGV